MTKVVFLISSPLIIAALARWRWPTTRICRLVIGFWILGMSIVTINFALITAVAIQIVHAMNQLPESIPYDMEISTAATRHEISPLLLAALVRQESNFEATAVSSAGAMGLGQLMPDTAVALGVADPFDPAQNLDGAASYLAQMLARYGGDLRLALAAYNAGPARVDACYCVPPISETQQYVVNVLQYYNEYKQVGNGRLYSVPVVVTNPQLHGLDGWQGVDIHGGCGAILLNPLGEARVTYNGLDGYSVDGSAESTMLTLVSGDKVLTLLHGDYLLAVNDVVAPGQVIGYEAAHGNASGCHSHVILRVKRQTVNYLDYFREDVR